MNFINPKRLDKRFAYSRLNILASKIEYWFTEPLCSATGERSTKAEIGNTGTVLREVGSKKRKNLIKLGNFLKMAKKDKKKRFQNTNLALQ